MQETQAPHPPRLPIQLTLPPLILILGAGSGGLELASRLSREVVDDVEVTLIDQSDSFVFGFSKLDVMFGRRTMDEVRLPYCNSSKRLLRSPGQARVGTRLSIGSWSSRGPR